MTKQSKEESFAVNKTILNLLLKIPLMGQSFSRYFETFIRYIFAPWVFRSWADYPYLSSEVHLSEDLLNQSRFHYSWTKLNGLLELFYAFPWSSAHFLTTYFSNCTFLWKTIGFCPRINLSFFRESEFHIYWLIFGAF